MNNLNVSISFKNSQLIVPKGVKVSSETTDSLSPASFKAGNSQNTMALLNLISVFMKLSRLKNIFAMKQEVLESKVSISYSESQIARGKKEMGQYLTEGIFGAVNGAFNVGLGIHGAFEERKLVKLGKEAGGIKKFMKNIEDLDPNISMTDETAQQESNAKNSVQNRLEKLINEIETEKFQLFDKDGNASSLKTTKNKDLEFSDQEMLQVLDNEQIIKLKTAIKDRIKAKEEEMSAERERIHSMQTKRQIFSQASQGILDGSGKIGAGVLKGDQAKIEADITQYQTAQQKFQSLAKESASQSDKELQSAESLTNLISEIDKSNNPILNP